MDKDNCLDVHIEIQAPLGRAMGLTPKQHIELNLGYWLSQLEDEITKREFEPDVYTVNITARRYK